MEYINCLSCGKQIKKINSTIKYCGSSKKKTGCSYLRRKEWQREHYHNVVKTKDWYLLNLENRKIYIKDYYLNNKDKIKELNKIYVEKNKENITQKRKEYTLKTKDKKKEYDKKYNMINKDKRNKYYYKTKEYHRNYTLNRNFGISLNEYNILLENQNNLCAICKNQEIIFNKKGELRKLAVDHNHNTGKVRGLLCSNCNTSLGGFKDDISLLKNAIDYLNKYR